MLSIGQMHKWKQKIRVAHSEKLSTNIEPMQSHDFENIFSKQKIEENNFSF